MTEFKSRLIKLISLNGFIGYFNYDKDYSYIDILKYIKNNYFQDKEIIQLNCIIDTYKLPSIFNYKSRYSLYKLLIENNIYTCDIIITVITVNLEKEVILMYKELHVYKKNERYYPDIYLDYYDDEYENINRYINESKINTIIRIYIYERIDVIDLQEAIMLIDFNNSIIKILPDIYRNKKEYILEIIQYFPKIYNYIDLVLTNDIDIINAAVNNNGLILKYINDDLKNKQIVIKAIINNGNSIKYVPRHLVTQEMIIYIINDNKKIYDDFYEYSYYEYKKEYSLDDSILKYIPENIIDKELWFRLNLFFK